MVKGKKFHFFIVEDDITMLEFYKALLESAGHKVSSASSSEEGLKQILALKPDCVLSDLIMPGMDGLELFQQLRKHTEIEQPIFILITTKKYEFDQRRALLFGVDGYFTKPVNPDSFVEEIVNIIEDIVTVQFWGVRGTLPVPGKNAIRYGGNTNCVTVAFPKNKFFIFDAGTGIKALSDYLISHKKTPLSAKIFITHPHYDHIHGFPFFVPFYMQGNDFEIFGTKHFNIDIKQLIANQMDSVYFPITVKEFAANLSYHNLNENSVDVEGIHVETMLLSHPGRCIGFRVKYKKKVFCYITDNEIYLENSPHYNQFERDRLIHFISQADVAIMDATYSDDEYVKKIHWGHSSVSGVVEIANEARVKNLFLYHHDPSQTDSDIDLKLKQAKSMLKSLHSETKCFAPKEGDKILI